MGDLVLTAEQLVPEPVSKTFARFGAQAGSGWLFDVECDLVASGSVVRLSMPVPGGGVVLVTGRIVQVVKDRRIVVRQESPWSGRIVITFRAEGAQTKVRLGVTVSDECVAWLGRAAGHNVPEVGQSPGGVQVGLLVSLSGTAGLLGRASQNAAEMAVEELNADGGICRLPVTLHTGDDSTNTMVAQREFRRLTDVVGCDVVVAMVSSASMAAIRPAAEARGTLLLYPPANEGGPAAGRIFHFGERPHDQLAHSIPLLMAETGGKGWFLVGNDYSWPRAVFNVGRRVIENAAGVVLGATLLPMGSEDLDGTLQAIEESGAEHVVSAMVGTDAVAFERRFYDAGLRNTTRTIATLVDDTVREHIGDAAAAGIWSPLDHVAGQDGPIDSDLMNRWHRKFGPLSPPMSSTAKSVYDAIHLYGQSAHLARSTAPEAVAQAVRSSRHRGFSVRDRSAGRPHPTPIAEAVPGGFKIREAYV
jgi:urea transport system substrate-binding protein